MKITTNHNWRAFCYRDEVPASVLADQFDYLDEETFDGFICYRGAWYHLSDFERRDPRSIEGWHGVHCDSFFSGVVIRLSSDGERYQIGTMIA